MPRSENDELLGRYKKPLLFNHPLTLKQSVVTANSIEQVKSKMLGNYTMLYLLGFRAVEHVFYFGGNAC